MKANFIHVCFVIDESSSMFSSVDSVVEGFAKVINEQKANTEGTCAISLFKFNSTVSEVYRGVDVHKVQYLEKDLNPNWMGICSSSLVSANVYSPNGMTALYDGVGTAIDTIGKWLASMPEDERPEKNLIVVMTDGGENSSLRYSLKDMQDKIKHQTEKYNWTFMYIGTDVADLSEARELGFTYAANSSRTDVSSNYEVISSLATCYRTTEGDYAVKNAVFLNACDDEVAEINSKYDSKVNDIIGSSEIGSISISNS